MLNITRRHTRLTRLPPRDLSEDSCSLFFAKNPRWLMLRFPDSVRHRCSKHGSRWRPEGQYARHLRVSRETIEEQWWEGLLWVGLCAKVHLISTVSLFLECGGLDERGMQAPLEQSSAAHPAPPPPTPPLPPISPSTRLPPTTATSLIPRPPWRSTAPLRCIACCYVFNSLSKKASSATLLLLLLFAFGLFLFRFVCTTLECKVQTDWSI